LTASKRSVKENVYGNYKIHQFEPYPKILIEKILGEEKLSKKKFQQEKVERPEIWT